MWMAAVPVEQAMACFDPTWSAKRRSNSETKGPTDETKPDSTASRT